MPRIYVAHFPYWTKFCGAFAIADMNYEIYKPHTSSMNQHACPGAIIAMSWHFTITLVYQTIAYNCAHNVETNNQFRCAPREKPQRDQFCFTILYSLLCTYSKKHPAAISTYTKLSSGSRLQKTCLWCPCNNAGVKIHLPSPEFCLWYFKHQNYTAASDARICERASRNAWTM